MGSATLIVSFLLVLGAVVFIHEFGISSWRGAAASKSKFSRSHGSRDRRPHRPPRRALALSAIPSALRSFRRRSRRGERPDGEALARMSRPSVARPLPGQRCWRARDRRRRADRQSRRRGPRPVRDRLLLRRALLPRESTTWWLAARRAAGFAAGDVIESVDSRRSLPSTTSSTS